MKKSAILFVIIFLFSIISFSQTQKGKFFIGGLAEIEFHNYETEGGDQSTESKNKQWSAGIPFGFFVSDHILIGLTTGFNRITSDIEYIGNYYNEGTQERENNRYSFGPFVRGYFNVSEKVDFFLDWNAIYGLGKESSSRYYEENGMIRNTEGKTTSFSTGIKPGISIHLSKWLFLDATIGWLGYNFFKYTPDEENESDTSLKSNSFAFNFNTFSLGLSAKLGK